MKCFLLKTFKLVCIFILSASASAADHVETINIDSGGKLTGSLILPDVKEKPAVVLIIAGSGPSDRDGNLPGARTDCLKQLAQQLATAGIASVRYDKRGVGESASAVVKESDLRFETYVNDAVAWAKKLKSDPRFSRVIIAGHSEGALIAILAASSGGADAVVSIEGASKPADEILRQQLSDKLPPALHDENEKILKQLKAGQLVQNIPNELAAIYRPSAQPYLVSWFSHDPAKVIKSLNVPVLIIQGDNDMQVPAAAALELSSAAKRRVVHVIPQMNHVLKKVPADISSQMASYQNPNLPIAEELSKYIEIFSKSL